MALDATVGGASADSYVTVAEADAYFASSANGGVWAPLAEDVKENRLKEATRILDLYYVWNGIKASETQALGWPRKKAYYPDGTLIPEDIIPVAVKYATFDLALFLYTNNGFTMEDNMLDMVKVGPITVDFLDNKSPSSMPKSILTYLAAYGTSTIPVPGGINAVRLVRT